MRTKKQQQLGGRVEATHKAETRLARLLFCLTFIFSFQDNFNFNKILLSFILCCHFAIQLLESL